MDGRACAADFGRDLMDGPALLMERHHALVARLACGSPVLSALFVDRRPFGGAPRRVHWPEQTRRLAQADMLSGQGALHNLARIHQQMKAVSNLFGLWCAHACGQGVISSAVAADEVNRGVALEPLDTRGLQAVGQEVNHAALFEIHEQRAIATCPPEREIIHPEDRHLRCQGLGMLGPGLRWIMDHDHPEDGRVGDRHT
jgi:hypothetical protein